jgi:uncharacterized integral membrane protein
MEMSGPSMPPEVPDAPEPARRRRLTRQNARHLLVAALASLATAFALLNFNHVKVNFLVTTQRPPLIVAIVICLAIGFLIGFATGRQRSGRDS